MERNLALEVVRVTEAAALAAARWLGRGDETSADAAAVEAMRREFKVVDVRGTVVIGEGERDEAPMLYAGEQVGTWRDGAPQVDIALDPLEGTTITARGDMNAVSVIAIGDPGRFLHAPDVYMDKIAVGPDAVGLVDLRRPADANLRRIAGRLGKDMAEMTVMILDRPRHEDLIGKVRSLGCRIRLIRDGDVAGAIATALPGSGVDCLMGIGGAPEGVLAAAAMRCLGGELQGRLVFRNDAERERARSMGVQDLDRVYGTEELAGGSVMFAATGVTDGPLLHGVRRHARAAETHSLVMRSSSGTVRFIQTTHRAGTGWEM